ncbi:MAG TPA: hypothetical protein VH599_09150 [Ktedonobacterales bacterium]|jgi:hypothetical protein
MQTNLPGIISVRIMENEPPIDALRLPDGRTGATLRSLCALLDIDKGRQVARIKRNPALSEALVLIVVDTPGGPQPTDILHTWAISVWATGLHISRLPEAKRPVALVLQREAFTEIERAFAERENNASAPPPPDPSPLPQSVWQDAYTFIDHLKALYEETQNQVAVVQYDQQSQALRITALEAGNASPAKGLSGQRLAYIYQRADKLRQAQGYPIADVLAGLAAHFRVADIYDLPEKDWPAVLDWFASLLEE